MFHTNTALKMNNCADKSPFFYGNIQSDIPNCNSLIRFIDGNLALTNAHFIQLCCPFVSETHKISGFYYLFIFKEVCMKFYSTTLSVDRLL